jgi:PAS domain S-box-containing protein
LSISTYGKNAFSGVSFRSVVAFTAAYYLSVRLGEAAYGTLAVSSPFWLPNAVLLSTFLLTQKKHWALIAAAVFPIRLLAGAPLGTPLWFLLFSSADDLLTTLLAGWLLRRVLRRGVRLDTVHDFVSFLVIAAGIAPALSALIAAFGRHALGDSTLTAAYRWFLGNGLGQAIVTPTLLYWYVAGRERLYPPLKELALVSGGLMAVLLYAFVFRAGPYSPILSYAPVPFIVWAALRLGPIGTATVILPVACASMLSAVEDVGLFSKGSPSQNVLSLQLFLFVVSASLLSLSIVIDERKRAEEILRESEEKFHRVFRNAAVGMVIVSPDGHFLAANSAFCKCFGYTEEELTHKTVQSLTHPEDWPSFSRKFSEGLEQRDGFQRVENRCLHKSGRIVFTESSTSLIRGREGEPQYFVGEMLDITERMQAEEALRSVNRRLIEAHEEERVRIARELHDDICQRLALLAINLEGLQDNLPSLETEIGKAIAEAGELVQALSSDVQALSHHLHSSRLELLGLAVASAGFCREVSNRQGMQIDFHSENIPADVPKEASLCLFRILQEAIQNATKHSGSQHVEVSLRGGLSEIELTVRDSGIGFDSVETIEKHGIGLISMKERLKLVNGNLSINSQPHVGTTIQASVPLTPRAKAAGETG